MSEGLVLRGEIVDDDSDILRRKVERLHTDLTRMKEILEESERQLTITRRIIKQMRKQLEPQYRSLQALFGEMDAAGVEADGHFDAAQPIPEGKYAAWKQRLSPAAGKVIDGLLVQPMTHTQLIGYCKMHYNTIAGALKVLSANSLIEKSGNVWSLKR